MRATGSAAVESMTSVAPSSFASANLFSTTSTAMMRSAPAMRQPWIAASPTPPAPNTAAVEPGSTRAQFRTAPMPVITPQLISAATSNGMSSAIFTAAFSCSSMRSAKLERSKKSWSASPVAASLSLGCSFGARRTSCLSQRLGWPVVQRSQLPQNTERFAMR